MTGQLSGGGGGGGGGGGCEGGLSVLLCHTQMVKIYKNNTQRNINRNQKLRLESHKTKT